MTQSRGRFISFEGIEGAGKSTVIARVAAWLEDRGQSVVLSREPGGTPLAEAIRETLLADHDEPMPADAELLLIFAARAAHLANRIRPALAQGQWVLCDRFLDASRAYQGAGRGMELAWIDELASRVVGSDRPDQVVILDLPVAQGFERARARGAMNRFDREDAAFMQRVREHYLASAAKEPRRYTVIDASQAIDDVVTAAQAAIGAPR